MMIAGMLIDSFNETGANLWRAADQFPALRPGELHMWSLRIDPSRESLVGSTLSPDELRRAARFRHAEHQAEFAVCRGALRVLLGRYIGVDPADVQISYAEDGKPLLDHRLSNLKFNVSHSDEYALFAFSLDAEVGVDIERIDAGVIDAGMLRHCFHDNELEKYDGLADNEKAHFFFQCWTRKEAYLKLRGDGFAVPPTAIDLLSTRGDELRFETSPACFTELPPIDGYAAVIATRDKPQNICYYKLGSSVLRYN